MWRFGVKKWPTDGNDVGAATPKPLRRRTQGRILDSLSGFTKVSTAEKPGGVIPDRPGLLRED